MTEFSLIIKALVQINYEKSLKWKAPPAKYWAGHKESQYNPEDISKNHSLVHNVQDNTPGSKQDQIRMLHSISFISTTKILKYII